MFSSICAFAAMSSSCLPVVVPSWQETSDPETAIELLIVALTLLKILLGLGG